MLVDIEALSDGLPNPAHSGRAYKSSSSFSNVIDTVGCVPDSKYISYTQ